MNNIILLLAFFAIMYFMMIRPQQKQQKKRKEMLESLRKSDKIITIGGIEGVIKSLKDDRVVIEIAKGVNITVLKTAIGQVINEEEREESKALTEGEEE